MKSTGLTRGWGETLVIFFAGCVLLLTLPMASGQTLRDLAVNLADVTVIGAEAGDLLGAGRTLAAGDVNGDDIADLVLGAFGADGDGNTRDDAGEVYAFFGSSSIAGTFDLATTTPSLRIIGRDASDQLGFSVAVGDYNGDGIKDLLLGARWADGPGNTRSNTGEIYVIFGSPALGGAIDLSTTSPNLTVFGVDPGDNLGDWVAAGDVNGDGIDDLLLGALHADGPGNAKNDAGEVYVIFGSPSLGGTIDLAITSAGLTILGADGGDQLGTSLAAGDVNGDCIDDLVMSAYRADGPGNTRFDGGEAYVIFGSHSLGGTINLATTSPDLTILGADLSDNFGVSVAAGDFNQDGKDDMLLGAWLAKCVGNARWEAGEAYVVLGKSTLGGTIDLASTSPDLIIYGANPSDMLGHSVASGDLNGDGFDDVIVAALQYVTSKPGEVYVFLGSPTLGGVVDLASASADITVRGADPADRLGQEVGAGDVNGDRADDLVLGAAWAKGPGNSRYNAGEAYVIFGVPSAIPPTISCPSDVTVNNTPDRCSAPVTFNVTATGTPEPTIECKVGSMVITSPHTFDVGTTTVNCTATNSAGSASCSFTVTVIDNQKPTITVALAPTTLWPPNNKMRPVAATVAITDNCAGVSCVLTSITSNEPGSDDIRGAAYNTLDNVFELRAKRLGTGNGRVYTVTYTATDASGNSTSGSATVTVPHDMGKGSILSYSAEIPDRVALGQNYPNPFNPATIIQYDIPSAGRVTLKVYNALGQAVAVLVDEDLPAGRYQVNCDASGIPSGVYFYRLSAGGLVETKRLLILK